MKAMFDGQRVVTADHRQRGIDRDADHDRVGDVPSPGRWRSGIQSSITVRLIRIVASPIESGVCTRHPLREHRPGRVAEPDATSSASPTPNSHSPHPSRSNSRRRRQPARARRGGGRSRAGLPASARPSRTNRSPGAGPAATALASRPSTPATYSSSTARVHRPHPPQHGRPLGSEGGLIAPPVRRAAPALQQAFGLDPIHQPGQPARADRDHGPRQFEHPQRVARRTTQCPQHVVPGERRQLRRGETPLHLAGDGRMHIQHATPGVELRSAGCRASSEKITTQYLQRKQFEIL